MDGGWRREKRGSRPTSSENSSPAEFLISPRRPHSRREFRGWKKKVEEREREREREEPRSGGGERRDRGG